LREPASAAPDPRVVRTRATVLDAAIDLLAERGYSGFSMEAIVESTGVAKTTLYRHWPSRNALLGAVIKALEGGGQLPDSGSLRQDMLEFFAGRVRAVQTHRWERCMPALVESASHDPVLAKIVAALTMQTVEQLEILLKRGQDRGELRRDIRLDLVASLLIGPFVFRRLLLQKPPTNHDVATMVDLVLQGVSLSRQ
jgi:AcrR family transcriptional regulator